MQRILVGSGVYDKSLRMKKKVGEGRSNICIFRDDALRSASARHALLLLFFLFIPLLLFVTAHCEHADMDCPDHD
jgi:hypothetical protein